MTLLLQGCQIEPASSGPAGRRLFHNADLFSFAWQLCSFPLAQKCVCISNAKKSRWDMRESQGQVETIIKVRIISIQSQRNLLFRCAQKRNEDFFAPFTGGAGAGLFSLSLDRVHTERSLLFGESRSTPDSPCLGQHKRLLNPSSRSSGLIFMSALMRSKNGRNPHSLG